MRYSLSSGSEDGCTSLRVRCASTEADAEKQAQHLRSWAVIKGAAINGHPFLRVAADGGLTVGLPMGGAVSPDTQAGLDLEETPEGPVIKVEEVPFAALLEVAQALRERLGKECGPSDHVDYSPGPDGWAVGSVSWRVTKLPAALPEYIEVEVAEPVAPASGNGTNGSAAPDAALAGRRFSVHLPRWGRHAG